MNTTTIRSAVLQPGTKPHTGWTIEPCRDCQGAGVYPAHYLCLHCGGAGYFQRNPNPVEPARYTPSKPTCSQCGSHQVTVKLEAWGDAKDCADCGDHKFYSIGD